jgi:hypothetical protein
VDFTHSDTPVFPAYGKGDRCPDCAVRVGAAHLKRCKYTGLCKARLRDNTLKPAGPTAPPTG